MPHHPFKKILVAVDGSFHANIAARYSLAFADAFSSKIFVATVLTKEMGEKGEKSAANSIAKVLDDSQEMGLDIEGVILKGDVIEAIDRFVRDNKVDIVIASTRRPHKERRFFARSITSALMSRLPCSVAGLKITHPGRSVRPGKVLVPVIGDGYRDKERAEIVEALIHKFDSKVTVFHVIELGDLNINRLDRLEKERLTLSAEKRLLSFLDELKGRRLIVSERIVIGRNAREEIISEASHHKYDLIIVGATTRNILKRMVSGNPVEEILRDTPCDVMLVHFK